MTNLCMPCLEEAKVETRPIIRRELVCHSCNKRRICFKFNEDPRQQNKPQKNDEEIEGYRCSNCEAVIQRVRYRTNCYEYGMYAIDADDYNCDGTAGHEDPTYECPECDNEVDPEELEIVYKDEEEETDGMPE